MYGRTGHLKPPFNLVEFLSLHSGQHTVQDPHPCIEVVFVGFLNSDCIDYCLVVLRKTFAYLVGNTNSLRKVPGAPCIRPWISLHVPSTQAATHITSYDSSTCLGEQCRPVCIGIFRGAFETPEVLQGYALYSDLFSVLCCDACVHMGPAFTLSCVPFRGVEPLSILTCPALLILQERCF